MKMFLLLVITGFLSCVSAFMEKGNYVSNDTEG